MSVGFVWDELYGWASGKDRSLDFWTQPGEEYWENADSKRRIFSLVSATSELKPFLVRVEARDALEEELTYFHTPGYVDRIRTASSSHGLHEAGECAKFSLGGFDVGLRAAGGVLAACDAVCAGTCTSAYALVRPPGHHARADCGMGFCLFNNIVVATRHLQRTTSYKRIAIVDYDVHHGNGTQEAFYADSSVLFISVHQESNYPHDSGPYTDIGAGGSDAEGTTINIPLPPGSGHGAYMAALHTIILPALDAFAPDFLLVSSGFDASFQDPLASMMLSSVTFGAYARALQTAANRLCHGRLVCAHEGGYSKDYVPYCGLAVIDQLACMTMPMAYSRNETAACRSDGTAAAAASAAAAAAATATAGDLKGSDAAGEVDRDGHPKSLLHANKEDPYLVEAQGWGGQDLQRHQFLLINAVFKTHATYLLRGTAPPVVPAVLRRHHADRLERFLDPEQDPTGEFLVTPLLPLLPSPKDLKRKR